MKKAAKQESLRSMKILAVFCLICTVTLSGCINNEQNNNGTRTEKGDANIESSPKISTEDSETDNASIEANETTYSGSTETSKVVTKADNGKSVNLKNGDTFSLELRENPSTGYSWQLNLSKGLSILSDKSISDPAAEGQVGVPVTHSWEIKAVTQGSQQIKGIYKQPWMNTTVAETNFTLNVEVV